MNFDIEALANLIKNTSENEVGPSSTSAEPRATPATIGPQGIFPGVKVPAPKKPNSRAIWADDEVPDVPDDDVDDARDVPQYDIVYKQAVGTQDSYLGLSGKDPSSSCCEEIAIKIQLPGTSSMKELDLDVQRTILRLHSPTYRLVLHLPHPVVSDRGSAKYDPAKQQLTVTLPVIREIDYRELPY